MKGLTNQELHEWSTSECAKWYVEKLSDRIDDHLQRIAGGGTSTDDPVKSGFETGKEIARIEGLREAIIELQEYVDDTGSDRGEDTSQTDQR